MTLTPRASSCCSMDAALLELAHSRATIYEHSRMSGEHRRRLKLLPVNRADSCSDALQADYALNLARHFGEVPPYRRALSLPVPGGERALDVALLLAAHSERSIYETTRLSGEHRHHKVLPTDGRAERSDVCSDATDQSYASAMAKYFVTEERSRL